MALKKVELGDLSVSQLIIGGNPFSGFSHQGPERDKEMREYYTPQRIKATWREAETLGINTCIARGDQHIISLLKEYRVEGSRIQWIAQTASEAPTALEGVKWALAASPVACFIHGGVVMHLLAQGREDLLREAVQAIKDTGLPAGIASHQPASFVWAEEHLDCDFYMCSYYDPARRDQNPRYDPRSNERFREEDRQAMAAMIQKLRPPVIHYKVLAAGRQDPRSAFEFVAKTMRPGDAVCVGFFTKDKPDMIREDIAILEESLRKRGL